MTGLFALAFGAGLLSPINPCGFALLPAYLACYLGTDDTCRSLGIRLGYGLRSGIALSLGFAGTLSAAGLVMALGARSLLRAAPWLSLGIGVALAVIGLIMLTGRSPYLRLPGFLHQAPTAPSTLPRTVAFGAGYALVSLTCTFGVLLAVIGQALAANDTLSVVGVFAAYAAGAATLLLLVSSFAALTSTALHRISRTLSRVSGRIAGAVLVVTGGYLVAYWLPTATGNDATTGLSTSVTATAAAAQTWVEAHQTLVILGAGFAVTAGLTATVLIRRRLHRGGRRGEAERVQP